MIKKTKPPNLSDKKIIIISHVFASGPAQALLKYTTEINSAGEVLFIGHPLFYQPQNKFGSFSELYLADKQVKKKTIKNFKLPPVPAFIKDLIFSVYWVVKSGKRWDLIICANNLNSLAGIILRQLGRVKKVIFYTVDYIPLRFKNRFLNESYHLIDRLCAYWANEIWNLSPRMEIARRKYRGIKTKPGKQKVVPMGIWLKGIKRLPFNKIEKHTLVFMGHLIEKQGVQFVIKAMPGIIKKIPDFKFLIIGTGEYENQLKKLAKKLNLEKNIEFTGYVKSHEEMENMMARCACGIALYQQGDKQRNFTYYADPGKIKDYLGAGLPIILTDVPHNARQLVKNECGIIVKNDSKDIARAIIGFLGNEKKLRKYRQNALSYIKDFDWNVIFNQYLI